MTISGFWIIAILIYKIHIFKNKSIWSREKIYQKRNIFVFLFAVVENPDTYSKWRYFLKSNS